MIPIRDAFDQIGRERFKGEWTGDEIALLDDWPSVTTLPLLSVSKRAAFERCAAVVAFLTVELEAGRVVVVTTDARHRPHDVAAHHWRDSAHNGHWQDGAENLAEYLTDLGTSRFIRFVTTKATVGAGPGAPPKYEKGDLQKRFNERCREVGFPNLANEKEWQRQADVAKWIAEQIEKMEGVKPDHRDKAIRTYAKEFMEQWRSA